MTSTAPQHLPSNHPSLKRVRKNVALRSISQTSAVRFDAGCTEGASGPPIASPPRSSLTSGLVGFRVLRLSVPTLLVLLFGRVAILDGFGSVIFALVDATFGRCRLLARFGVRHSFRPFLEVDRTTSAPDAVQHNRPAYVGIDRFSTFETLSSVRRLRA
jgi:hypothetical protein